MDVQVKVEDCAELVDNLTVEDDECFQVEHNPISNNEDYEQSSPSSKGNTTQTTNGSMESKRYSVSDNSNLELKSRPLLPAVNCCEKIIICLDMASEANQGSFRLEGGIVYDPIFMLKRVLEIFLNAKSRMNPSHEFALMILHDVGVWQLNFTKDIKSILYCLAALENLPSCETADLTSCFDLIESKVTLPVVENVETPPPYIVRTILIYGRSHCVPQFMKGNESFKRLVSSNYFTIDVLYVHLLPNDSNKCQEIFEMLCSLDEYGDSFIYEVARNPKKLHDCMSKLLAHPLQRSLQKDFGNECSLM